MIKVKAYRQRTRHTAADEKIPVAHARPGLAIRRRTAAPLAAGSGVKARIDFPQADADGQRRLALSFDAPVATLTAHALAEVPAVLDAAMEAARAGRLIQAVGYIHTKIFGA